MDILKPPIIFIDGRCYRQNSVQRPEEWAKPEANNEEDMYMYNEEHLEESCELLDWKKTENGYSLALEVPNSLFGCIIGRQGETLKGIEQETKTKIIIPRKSNTEDDQIVIRGEQKAGIISAKTRIDLIVSSARQKTHFTHLLTMPVNTLSVQQSFQEFKEDVLRESRGDEHLDESLFQKPAKLHLTIGTLVLLSRKEVSQAKELLEKCKQDVVSPILEGSFPLVSLNGLEYMNDDPGKVDVLYAKATMKDGSNKLQLICDSLADHFTKAGLMPQQYDHVKIHITLINTLFRKDPDAEGTSQRQRGRRREGGREKVRESFDASRILQDFRDYSFGDCLIDSIHISQQGSYGADGYYLPVGKVAIP